MAQTQQPDNLRFGVFLAPYHLPGQSPQVLYQDDMDLIRNMDEWGYDEIWIGEHHSGGWETIASPEMFIAWAAAQTSNIHFGTGVLSLPYHHPLLVADRMVQLDHLTRGRISMGVGPGQLPSDAFMMGIDTNKQRTMMAEALDVIVALMKGEVVSRKTDWFTLNEARLQISSYTRPMMEIAVAASISPAGPQLAARYGGALLSVAATREQGFDAVGYHWGIMEESAQKYQQTVSRDKWRLVGPMHIAESLEQAKEDVRYGLLAYEDYLRKHIMYNPPEDCSWDEYIDKKNETGSMIIGTPDMAVKQIKRLWEQSGGFGSYLISGIDLADYGPRMRSYELFAREVMPHFKGQMTSTAASCEWTTAKSATWTEQTATAIGNAIEGYQSSSEQKT